MNQQINGQKGAVRVADRIERQEPVEVVRVLSVEECPGRVIERAVEVSHSPVGTQTNSTRLVQETNA
jgi:hypothetical protein